MLPAMRPNTLAMRRLPLVAACRFSTGLGSRSADNPKIMIEQQDGFGFARHNPRPPKPRKIGVTEIRGPYYSAIGKRYLQDVFDTFVWLPAIDIG